MEEDVRLTNGIVTLRPYQISDIDSLYEAACESIPEMFVWMPWCHPDYSIEESRTWIESQPEEWEKGIAYGFAITDSSNGLFLGGCGINRIEKEWGLANLGYWVRTSRTKKGVATAATLLLARFAFNELKLNRVEIITAVDNKASLRVAEKAGATKEGILGNGTTMNGNPCDAVVFSLIPQDLPQSSIHPER